MEIVGLVVVDRPEPLFSENRGAKIGDGSCFNIQRDDILSRGVS